MMKKEALARLMAKRLTKALREKRRWLGVLVEPACTARSDVEERLDALTSTLEPTPNVRLMDFVSAKQRFERNPPVDFTAEEGGIAILRIHLKDAPRLRPLLQAEDALEQHGIRSLTTSGKIRLVRQRLGLPKPPRRR